MESAINRAKIYIEAGADLIIPAGLGSGDEFLEFSTKIREFTQ